MGEAKRKAASVTKWLDGLPVEERIVFDTASDLFNKLIKPENISRMCYHSVFFLHEYLKNKHSIITTPIIGYVNDGTDDVMMSHAWLEFHGKKTDVSIAVTADPDMWPMGELIILDQVMKSGHKYTYHSEMTESGLQAMMRMSNQKIVTHKMEEHAIMTARSKNPDLIRPYLDGDPNGRDYNRIAEIIEK